MKRNNSLDLLRIICSIMVIIEHFCETGMLNGFGIVSQYGSINGLYFYNLLYSFSRCAVNTFVIISGFFLINKTEVKISKLFTLIIMAVFFNEISYFVGIISGDTAFSIGKVISHMIPGNYYLSFYCVLYILSPFLNKIVKDYSIQKFAGFICILFVLFSFWPTLVYTLQTITSTHLVGSFSVSLNGTDMGFNIINFLLLYFIGGFLNKCFESLNTHKKLVLIISFSVVILCVGIGTISSLKYETDNIFRYYDNIFVILLATALFTIFLSFQIKRDMIILFDMGRSTFGVFLMHYMVLKTLNKIVSVKDFMLITNGNSLLTILFYVVVTYLVSVVLAILYLKVTDFIRSRYLDRTTIYQVYIRQ